MDRLDFLKLAIEASSLSLSLLCFSQYTRALSKSSEMLAFLSHAYVFSPSILLGQLEENIPEILQRNLYYLEEDDLNAKFLAFVKGTVSSKNTIPSQMNNKKMIVTKVILEPIFSNSERRDPREEVLRVEMVPEFELIDEKSPTRVPVRNDKTVEFVDALRFNESRNSIIKMSSMLAFFSKLLLTVQMIFSSFRIPLSVKGWRIGTRMTEMGIFVNEMLMIFGKVSFDKKSKSLTVEKPYFYSKDKFQILAKYKQDISRLKKLQILFLILSVFLFIMVIRRLLRLGKALKQRYIQAKLKLQMDKLGGIRTLLTDDFKCIICSDNPKNVIFKPCLHFAMCKLCYDKLLKQNCPICRKPITDSVVIFVA